MEKRNTFTNKLGFVLASAGASVGLGNIWRFPYLAAKYGGGAFLLVYILLALTFGYTMIVSETVIGRSSHQSPIGAFRAYSQSRLMKLGGWINAIIPILIVPYYSVIGGWVCKYCYAYLTSDLQIMAGDNFFTDFMTNGMQTEFWFILFVAMVMLVICLGLKNGIERVSRFMMPILVVLAVIISGYSVTRPGALKGVAYFLIPRLENFSLMTIVAAMGQMFYSLSIAMGILITFGSYMKDDISIESSTQQVEIFDTGIAILAGMMIIPAVFAFSQGNPEALNKGPGLMFVTMPKIFASMGMGRIVGLMFFFLVFFAALTSAIALTESAVSTFTDELHYSRLKASAILSVIMIVLGSLSSLGYGPLAMITILKMPFLDFFDFLTNSLMMPIAAMMICLLIVRHVGLKTVEEEVTKGNHPFKRKNIYNFMIRLVCPLFIMIILLSSIAAALGLIHM